MSVFKGEEISVAFSAFSGQSLKLRTCKNVMNSIQHKVQIKIVLSLKVIAPCNFFNVSVYVCLGQMLMKFQGPKNYFFYLTRSIS